ncbi:MAG: PAS domain S-box protein [Betaproteobacteria bacterium]|nr:PAS domain S-box protein [Betaproteobacteria bacterium]
MKSEEQNKIGIAGFLILATLTLAAGISVYAVMFRASENILSKTLQLSLKSGEALVSNRISGELANAQMMVNRPPAIDSLSRLKADHPGREPVETLARMAQAWVASGRFSAVSFQDAAGAEVASAGSFLKHQDQRIALHTPAEAYLAWDRQFVLHAQLTLRDDLENRVGSVLLEARLPSLETAVRDITSVGNTSEIALCSPVSAREMDCYLGSAATSQFKRLQRIVDNAALPMNYALEGGTGVVFAKDYRRQNVAAAYSPVGELGIGMALKIDQSELYDPITQQLKRVGILLFALLLAGELMLYLMVSPLVRKLVDSRRTAIANFREMQSLSEKNSILLRNASDGAHILEKDGTLIECSDSFCNMLGYTREELLGKRISFWDAQMTEQEIQNSLDLHISGQGPTLFETRHRRKNGEIIDVEVSSRPIPLEGRVVLFNSSRNITERKLKDAEVRRSRKRLEELLENMSSGVAVYQVVADGADFRFTRVNQATERINHVRREDLVGRNITEVFPGVEEMGLLDAFRRVWKSGNPEHMPVSFYHDEHLTGWRENYIYKIESGEIVAIYDDVTERMLLQEALHRERDFMDAIFQSAGSLILAIDKHGCIVRFNHAAEHCSGYSFEEVKDKPYFWKNFLVPGQQQAVEAVFQNALAGNIRPRYENAWISRDGKTRVLDWANTLILDDEGQMKYLLAVGIDITERRQAESLIRIQSNALDASTNGIAIADASLPDLPLIYVNPAFEEITGYPEAELLGQNCRFLHRNDRDQSDLEEIRRALREGTQGKATLRNYRKDGSLFWNRLHISPIRDGSGKVTHFLGVSNDITDRRNAEEYMRLVSSVFHHADEAIVITDTQASILEVNPAFTRITGYGRDEVLGKKPDLLQSERQDETFYEALWQQLVQEGHWSGEVWNKRKNGETYPERLTLSAIKNESGETIRYVALFSDITDLKAQQQILERMAHHDALTGLPNRNLLGDRLDMAVALAKRTGEKLAICFVDLDGFKAINDTLGHEAGDLLLIEIAARLHAVCRATDTVARLGGDEFVLIFTNIVDEEECRHLTNRVLVTVEEPVHLQGRDVKISASIGVALFPDTSLDGDALLRLADQAMYAAKQSGRGRVHFASGSAGAALA